MVAPRVSTARGIRPTFALERFVPYLMTQIYHRLNKSFSGALRPLHLNPAQWRVLANLSARDGHTFTELLQYTALDQPTLSRTVARLVSKGFILRKTRPHDGRAVELWMTAAGREMFSRALPIGQQQYRLTVRGITAMNGRPSKCAKYASLTAVEPDEASTSVVPSVMLPLQMP